MSYGLLADAVVLVHVAFVAFVLLGGLLVWRWRRAAWVHLPAVVWGIGIEWVGGVCPLTPLENWLRARAGVGAYDRDFIEQYLMPILYPRGLTHGTQAALGTVALLVNLGVYWYVWRCRRRRGRLDL